MKAWKKWQLKKKKTSLEKKLIVEEQISFMPAGVQYFRPLV